MNASGPVAPPARARDTCQKKTSITVVRGAGGRGLVRRDSTCGGFSEGVLPTGDSIGRSKAFLAVIVAHHENIRRKDLDRTSELL